MDGSSASLIVIPIVVTISLAIWLIVVYYADSYHPRRRPGARHPGVTAPARPRWTVRACQTPGPEGTSPAFTGAIRYLAGTVISQLASWAGQARI
jgi:hypothetical protein